MPITKVGIETPTIEIVCVSRAETVRVQGRDHAEWCADNQGEKGRRQTSSTVAGRRSPISSRTGRCVRKLAEIP